MIRARDTDRNEKGEPVDDYIRDYLLDIANISIDELIDEYLDKDFYNTRERRKQAIERFKKGDMVKLNRPMPDKVSNKIESENEPEAVYVYRYEIHLNPEKTKKHSNERPVIYLDGDMMVLHDHSPFVFNSAERLSKEQVEERLKGTEGIQKIKMPYLTNKEIQELGWKGIYKVGWGYEYYIDHFLMVINLAYEHTLVKIYVLNKDGSEYIFFRGNVYSKEDLEKIMELIGIKEFVVS